MPFFLVYSLCNFPFLYYVSFKCMVKHKRYLFSHSFISTDHLCIGKHWEVLFLNMFVSLSDLSVLNHSIYYPQCFSLIYIVIFFLVYFHFVLIFVPFFRFSIDDSNYLLRHFVKYSYTLDLPLIVRRCRYIIVSVSWIRHRDVTCNSHS